MATLEDIDRLEKNLRIWNQMSIDLKKLKDDEMALRKKICKEIFGEGVRDSDKTLKFGMPSGMIVSATDKVSYKVDAPALSNLYAELTLEEQAAFKYKPELVMAAYKLLAKDSLAHEVVSIHPASPTLKVTLPDGD